MKFTLILVLIALAAAAAAPAASSESEEDTKVIVNDSLFKEKYLAYTSEYDIVSLVNPATAICIKDESNSSEDDNDDLKIPVFFVEAEVKAGVKEYKGLYSLDKRRNSTPKLVLANGRDTAFTVNKNKYEVYFAAADGIYFYDPVTKTAKKYGTFDKSVFAIAKAKNADIIYVLTDDKDLYKITDEGTTAVKVDAIEKAEAIALDFDNNLYFYTAGKAPQVYNGKKIKSFINLPSNPTYVALIRPPFETDDDYIIAIVNDQTYSLEKDGSIGNLKFELQVYPTAFGLDGGFIQYYAYNKKIYEYNFLVMILEKALVTGLESYLTSNEDKIRRISTNKV